MAKRKITAESDVTPELVKFREKRKWQIALRRYVLERNKCVAYAPYFGLDIENMRKWFEGQFSGNIGWDDFGGKWQFGHIIPVAYFDFDNPTDLKLCWNFINLYVDDYQDGAENQTRSDLYAAKSYFQALFDETHYHACLLYLKKIEDIEFSHTARSQSQQEFINQNRDYLAMVDDYSAFEFELLNSGRKLEEVKKEIEFFKKLNK